MNLTFNITTGVACVNLNRKFIGIEKDDKYYEVGTKRIFVALQDRESNMLKGLK